MTLGTGLPSYRVTSTFDGLMSRWMIPFWWACWIAWQTGTNSSSRSRGVRWLSSQYLVIGTPWTSSITKYGRPLSVVPASSTRAMFGWSIIARACRSASKRAMTCRRVHARLDDLEGHAAADRLRLLGHVDDAHAPFADLLEQLVRADHRAGAFLGRRRLIDGGRPAAEELSSLVVGLRARASTRTRRAASSPQAWARNAARSTGD